MEGRNASAWTTTGRTVLPGRSIPIGVRKGGTFDPDDALGERYRLVWVDRGSGLVTRGRSTLPFRAPACLCLDERERAEVTLSDPDSAVFAYFHPSIIRSDFDFDNVRPRARETLPLDAMRDAVWLDPFTDRTAPECGILLPGPALAKKALSLVERMEAEANGQATWWWPCRTRSYLIELLFALSSEIEDDRAFEGVSGEVKDPVVANVLLALNSRYAEDLTVTSLAAEFATNRTTLQERFRRFTGRSVAEYLQKVRLDIGRALLADTMLSVDEVADRSGYGSATGFCRAFKAAYGMSPRDYRQERGKALLAE